MVLHTTHRGVKLFWPGFLASLINRNWLELREKILARLYWGPSCSRVEQEQAMCSLACSPRGVVSWFLKWGRVGVCPGVRPEGWVRLFSHPSGGVVQRVCTVPCFCSQHPVFAPGSAEVAVGLLSFCIFWVQNLPQLHIWAVTFSPS